MSRDELYERAALYVMDLLDGESLRQFETELANNREARGAVERYRETVDLLAVTAAEVEPPADLENRIFDQIPNLAVSKRSDEANSAVGMQEESRPLESSFRWIPWGLAAILALTSAVLWNQRGEIFDELESLQAKYAAEVASFASLQEEYSEQIVSLEAEVKQLVSEGALQNLRIAVLKSKLEAAPNAQAIAVWNAAQQAGRLTVSELPALADNQDYQLWIIDPAYETPVSAGVFNTNENGELEYSFSGSESISSINAFALSLESKGGNPTPQGPIVLVSN